GGFDGAGDGREAAGVRGELAEQRVAGAAADEVDDVDVAAGQRLSTAEGAAVGEGEAVQDAADGLGGGGGRFLVGAAAELGDAGGHVARGKENRVVRIDDHGERGQAGGLGEQPVKAGDAPDPLGFLQKPEAHDVVQVADGPVDAKLVGEGRVGEDGAVELESDQGPGAAGDVGEGVGRGGDADHGGGGVVGGDGDHRDRARLANA